MDREKIERLSIDSVTGQLNEETEALLQEYLTEHPEANKWFLDMEDIYNKTQVVFDTKTASIKEQAKNKLTSKLNWFPVLRWAAVLAIAVTIGVATGRWSKPEVPQQKTHQITASNDTTIKSQGFRLEDIGDGFWRDKIAALTNTSTVKIHRETNSGLSLWEQYRRYKGEEL